MHQKIAFILSAGMGSRLHPHTLSKAKPCLPFLNLPLFTFSYFLCYQARLRKFIFNLHHLGPQVQKQILESTPANGHHDFIDESRKLLGSGGAIWNAKSHLKNLDSFLIANGDEVLIPQNPELLVEMSNTFFKQKPLACLLVTDHPELLKNFKAVWVNRYQEVVGFGMEPPQADCLPVHYTGYKIIGSKIFNYLPEGESNIFYDAMVKGIANGEKVITHHSSQLFWMETGNMKSFLLASQACLKLLQQQNPYLIQLMRFYGQDPREWTIVEKNGHWLYHHRDTHIPHNLEWSGVVTLGKKIKLGIKSKLHNVIVENHAVVPDHSQLDNTFLFANPTP